MAESKVGRVEDVQTIGISDVPSSVTDSLPDDAITAIELRVTLPRTRATAYAAWPDGMTESTLSPYLEWYDIEAGELIELTGREVRVRPVGDDWFVVPITTEE